MLDRWPFFRAATVALTAWACSSGPATSTRPSRLPAVPSPLPAARRTLKVQIRYDGELARSPDPKGRLTRRLEDAGRQLRAVAGVEVKIADFQPWRAPTGESTEGLLADLERVPPPAQVDLVVGFTSAPLPRRVRTGDVVHSRYAGRYVVVRTLADLFPRDAQALHDAEALLVMHGIARVFGALPACSPAVMAPNLGFGLGPRAWRFVPTNAALIHAHAPLDLQRASGRVSAAVAKASLALLSKTPRRLGCDAAAVQRRREVLQAVLGKPSAPADAAPAAPPPKDPDLVAGLSALATDDLETALAKCGPVAERRPASQASRCAGFAAAGLERREDAIRYLRAHLAHQPGDGDATLLLAKQIGREGDDAGARALLKRFVKSNPDHLPARVNLGVAHARLGELEAARAAWRAVLARDPEHRDAQNLLDQLPPE